MRKRFTDEQKAHVLAQAEAGVPVKELCRKYGTSDAPFYTWRKKYGGLAPSELQASEAARGREPQVEAPGR